MHNLGKKALPVLICITSDMMYWRKLRVFPSHKRILNEMKEKTSIRRSSRSLMRWLSEMEKSGIVTRNKRHRKSVIHGWEFRSSLYGVTSLGWNLLVRAGVWTWDQYRQLVGDARKTFRKKKKPHKVFRPRGDLTRIDAILRGILFNSS